MSASIAAHAGEAFHTTRSEGMGLGLFLAHAVVARFRGAIELNNEEGGGLKTVMRVPLEGWRI
jgi:two-component system sensor histidine kinase RegB